MSDLAFFSFLCVEILWDQQESHREWYNIRRYEQIQSKKSSLESMSWFPFFLVCCNFPRLTCIHVWHTPAQYFFNAWMRFHCLTAIFTILGRGWWFQFAFSKCCVRWFSGIQPDWKWANWIGFYEFISIRSRPSKSNSAEWIWRCRWRCQRRWALWFVLLRTGSAQYAFSQSRKLDI